MSNAHHSSVGENLSDDESQGLYGVVKKLSNKYADKFNLPREKTVSLCYEVLLKKSNRTYEVLPRDWEDDDILNATILEIHKRCKLKNNWTKELCSKVSRYFEILHENKNSDYYQNSVGPILKMLLCIEYNQKKVPQKEKKVDKFFDTEIISSYLNNIKNYQPKEEMQFFSMPNFHGIPHSESYGSILPFKLGNQLLTFDYVFRRENYKKVRSSNDLDEGFVTPNDDHLEKSPCLEIKHSNMPPPKDNKKFDWDYKVVCIPPRRHKTWETYHFIQNISEKPPFIHKDILLQQWLYNSPMDVNKISKGLLMHDIIVLLIGIPSTTFMLHEESFKMRDNIYTDELTPSALVASCKDFMESGAAFKMLSNLSECNVDDDIVTSAFKSSLREYLYKYQIFINQAYDKYKEKSYLKFIISMKPLVQQVTCLKKVLFQDIPLKGVPLLKHLFDLMGCAPSSSIFYILSFLFLLPCVYFFRLIDDWVFLGKWNKDLPLTPYSMELVNDRKSWVEAHTPINAEVPWFLPVHDLAHCGKAISLLSLSKNNDNFLNLLKSNNRPKVKLCLDLKELEKLKEECEKYYEEGKRSFSTNIEEEVDLVQCALKAAQIKTAAFESSRLEEKIKEIKKKKDELLLREEDLARSAQNKALRKQEDEAENERVLREQEEIIQKEQQEVLEKAKAVYEKYKIILEEEEKKERKIEWKIKRQALDEKRKEFLSKELNSFSTLGHPTELHLGENSAESVKDDYQKIELEKSTLDNIGTLDENPKKAAEYDNIVQNPVKTDDVNDNLKNMTDNLIDDKRNSNKSFLIQNTPFVDDNIENELRKGSYENENIEIESVMNSDINENLKTGSAEFERCDGDVLNRNTHETTTKNENEPVKNSKNEDKLSELQRNRKKVLGSDLGRGQDIRIHIWSEETERNKRNMLESHFHLDYNFHDNKKKSIESASLTRKTELVIKTNRCHKKVKETTEESVSRISSASQIEVNLSNESQKILLDIQDTEIEIGDKVNEMEDSTDNSSDVSVFKLFQDLKNNKMKDIFKTGNPIVISDKDIDYALLNSLVHHSLKTVLNIQVKLVNDALLNMFLREFGLLKVAQKLREYFFLHGEFGKRLTACLSKAVEEEEPATLLTFYRLRSIFVDACRGDIKEISFVVKETPVAFQHTSSQVLSCLSLTYKFEWPLNLIFTEVAVSKYNDIFEYMLSLHRVAWHLEEVCLSLNFKPIIIKGYQYTQIQLYRHVMSQFISTLRSYIVTTVIESCWRDFIKDASKVKDLDELYKRHAAYIMNIKSKCFLDEKSGRLMEQIQKLLEEVLIFCRVLRFGEWNVSNNEEYRHSNFKKLRSTFSSFLNLARTVTKYVEKLVKMNYQKDLESLYYFLTLNNFYIS